MIIKKTYYETIPVFFSCDDNYIPFLAVALRSLIDNASEKYQYKIHILNAGILSENKEKILKMKKENVDIYFADVTQKKKALGERLELRDYYTASIYFRIFIPEMFPMYEKTIYLDSDIVVEGDISKLFEADINSYLVGAVPDDIIASRKIFIDYAELGCGIEYNKYFNSGMLLMNTAQMRIERLEEKFVYLMNMYHFDTVCPDQDYLNVLCRDKVLYLDKGWNKMSIDKNYDGVPNIIHYNMFNKPWQYDDIPYGEYFWKYAANTDFYDDILSIKNSFGEKEIAEQNAGVENLIKNAARIAKSDFNFRTVYFNKQENVAI